MLANIIAEARRNGLARAASLMMIALTAACASAKAKPAWPGSATVSPLQVGKVKNLSSFGDRVYLAGQPVAEDFKLLADRGVKVVLNLRTDQEMKDLGLDEKAAVEAAGMKYVHVPLGKEEPTEEQLQSIMKLLGEAGETPVLMHCGSANRVGYAWSMFRATKQGVPADEALAEGKKVGLRSPELESRARAYIAQKNPQ